MRKRSRHVAQHVEADALETGFAAGELEPAVGDVALVRARPDLDANTMSCGPAHGEAKRCLRGSEPSSGMRITSRRAARVFSRARAPGRVAWKRTLITPDLKSPRSGRAARRSAGPRRSPSRSGGGTGRPQHRATARSPCGEVAGHHARVLVGKPLLSGLAIRHAAASPLRWLARRCGGSAGLPRVAVMPGQRHNAMDTATGLLTAQALSFLDAPDRQR